MTIRDLAGLLYALDARPCRSGDPELLLAAWDRVCEASLIGHRGHCTGDETTTCAVCERDAYVGLARRWGVSPLISLDVETITAAAEAHLARCETAASIEARTRNVWAECP